MTIHPTCEKPDIHLFTATNSLILASPKNCSKTRIVLISIIPDRATDFDTIYICMINRKDVLLQKVL